MCTVKTKYFNLFLSTIIGGGGGGGLTLPKPRPRSPCHVRDPGKDCGRKKLRTLSIEKKLENRKRVIHIKNTDELCCPCALVTVKGFRDFGCTHPEYRGLQKGRPVQKSKALELCPAVGVPEGPCGLTEIRTFREYPSDYQIVVVSVNQGYQVIFKGPSKLKTNNSSSSKSVTIFTDAIT